MIRGIQIAQPSWTTIRSCDQCRRDIDVMIDGHKSTLPTCYSVSVESDLHENGNIHYDFCSLSCLMTWTVDQGRMGPGLVDNPYPSYWNLKDKQ